MKPILLVFIMSVVFVSAGAQSSEVFVTDGKAIRGYDPVAFFAASKPVPGYDSLSFMYMDAKRLFSSASNLEAFKKDPAKYAPQYGGYCAYGTANGHKAPTETNTWTIVDDKLYFNYNSNVKKAWDKDKPALIKKADAQWPTVRKQQ